ncbi:Disease resistance protein TAO1 [Hondaea fermentalgiana]|uniref:Disease resistance protein TAO1 n=1 Tax=Hondaea fermentalgiana TaxID=2315210 RepID=A0A2R5G8Y4_9STRA|nr:Disease resistance protein TAO1 [Hondaea fermentalgiana]|eukprot:GBG24521.1 Disease resistance protein TAO1 [Hondaea fermentalgiana]
MEPRGEKSPARGARPSRGGPRVRSAPGRSKVRRVLRKWVDACDDENERALREGMRHVLERRCSRLPGTAASSKEYDCMKDYSSLDEDESDDERNGADQDDDEEEDDDEEGGLGGGNVKRDGQDGKKNRSDNDDHELLENHDDNESSHHSRRGDSELKENSEGGTERSPRNGLGFQGPRLSGHKIAQQMVGIIRSSLHRSMTRSRSSYRSEALSEEYESGSFPVPVPDPEPEVLASPAQREIDDDLRKILSDLDVHIDDEVLRDIEVTSCESLSEMCFSCPHLLGDKLGEEVLSKIWFTFLDFNGHVTIDFPEGIRSIPPLRYKGNVLARGALDSLCNVSVDGWLQAADVHFVENVRVEEDAKLARSPSLESVSRLFCGASLLVSFCRNLRYIDDDVIVRDDVSARDCIKLTKIPKGLHLRGSLDLKGCKSLESLPPGLSIGSKLILKESTSLRCLPADLKVESSIGLRQCVQLASLPDNFSCKLHLDLHYCVALKSLPDNLQVGGWANFSSSGIEALPANLQIGSNLRCDDTDIEFIPADLSLGGYLQARNCRRLCELPDGMHVEGNLELQNCTSLRKLPAQLTVDDTLNLRGCSALSELPEDLIVRRSINLEQCAAIRTLPRSLLEWSVSPQQVSLRPYATLGSRSLSSLDDPPHVFYLGGSGISPDEVARLRDFCTGIVRFEFSRRSSTDLGEYFDTLSQALSFWFEAAKIPPTDRFDPMRHLPESYERTLLSFLSKLRWSAEFRRSAFQEGLAKRVVSALGLLQEDAYSREEVLTRISDSVDACADKPIWALNQITLIAKLAHARGDREAIRALGRSVMRLEIVHEHVQRKIASIDIVDDVCVYLRFEVDLREDLDLPVAALDMLFPKFIEISSEEIDAARTEALSIGEAEFEIWLDAWPEWQRQLRHETAEKLTYADLPRNSRRFSMSWADVFGNTNLDDPVRVQRGGPVWSLADLLRHWVPTGLDLYNSPLTIAQVKHLSRCKSLPRGVAVHDLSSVPEQK